LSSEVETLKDKGFKTPISKVLDIT